MKNIWRIALVAILITACKDKVKETEAESTSEPMASTDMETQNDQWTPLFDGKSFNGWHEYLKEEVSDNWKIENGAMVFYPPENRQGKEIFDLVSDKAYTDFVLSMDWKISEGGNSGIFWGINEDLELEKPYHTGPEIQVLDNEKHPDAKNGTTHQSGSLYDMVAPSKDVTKPVGEWNTCIISINHKTNKGSVELNGEKIVDFPVNDPEWGEMVAKSKFADWEHFAKYTTGKIGLQDHGNGVAFRDIKIKEL